MGKEDPECLIGRSIWIHYKIDRLWYYGTVEKYSDMTKKHTIFYQDGERETKYIWKEYFIMDKEAPENGALILPYKRKDQEGYLSNFQEENSDYTPKSMKIESKKSKQNVGKLRKIRENREVEEGSNNENELNSSSDAGYESSEDIMTDQLSFHSAHKSNIPNLTISNEHICIIYI